ncbi:hypothetical protein ZIOFF_010293 [Zingiber officinale]|uniref:Pentatricopeptide repeat-containing protein n=1 Tax=Zingiber officinale TaxID=94328 RepID=A0A8J5HGS2_ZINOF|nr:hypothetical protein ZIOFF_010293 [Zingiber officinale]
MLRLGKSLHGYVFKNNMGDSPFVCDALIDMFGKCGNVKKARWIFSTMSEKNITSWNSMINCLALQRHSSLAIETFREMEQEGPQPNQVTFMGLLNVCTHAGLVDEGLDLLSQAGRFDVAMDIVRDMRIVPDVVVWGSLLNGARVHGAKDLAELALRKLLELEPKSVDYGFMLANLYRTEAAQRKKATMIQ